LGAFGDVGVVGGKRIWIEGEGFGFSFWVWICEWVCEWVWIFPVLRGDFSRLFPAIFPGVARLFLGSFPPVSRQFPAMRPLISRQLGVLESVFYICGLRNVGHMDCMDGMDGGGGGTDRADGIWGWFVESGEGGLVVLEGLFPLEEVAGVFRAFGGGVAVVVADFLFEGGDDGGECVVGVGWDDAVAPAQGLEVGGWGGGVDDWVGAGVGVGGVVSGSACVGVDEVVRVVRVHGFSLSGRHRKAD